MKKKVVLVFLLAVVSLTKFSFGQIDDQTPCPGIEPGTMIPSPIDCTAWFTCSAEYGVWEKNICPPGLEYDEATFQCCYPWEIVHECGCYIHE